jgi:hypothetical protein
MHVHRRLRLLIVVALVSALAATTVPAGASDGVTTPGVRQERRLVALHNASRVQAGLPPLTFSIAPLGMVRKHSRTMAQAGSHFHSSQQEITNTCTRLGSWQAAGENVGRGPDVDGLHQAFMASPPHAAAILNPAYNRIVVGVAARNGIFYATVRFCGQVPGRLATNVDGSNAAGMYRKVLQRVPRQGEVITRAMEIASVNRTAAARTVAFSDEFARREVRRLHRVVLRRPPTAAELKHRVRQLRNGRSLNDVSIALASSGELWWAMGGEARPWVRAIHRRLLGRAPTSAEVNAGVAELRRTSRSDVVRGIVLSNEALRREVRTRHHQLLGRGPGASAMQTYLPMAKADPRRVVRALAATGEFRRLHRNVNF